jgi:phosphoesterase RecJ-like protein
VIDLSFRAKAGFDVAKPARLLGGGGHMLASGAKIEGTLDEVRARVLALLREAVAQGALVIA